MSALEEKKIIIRLPRLEWRSFAKPRFGIAFSLLLCSALFAYWYNAIRPYLWISGAHVEAFSSIISSDLAGRITEMGPQEGDLDKIGDTVRFTTKGIWGHIK